MQTITKLLYIAFEQLYDRCVIDWHPEDGLPESFEGECEICMSPNVGIRGPFPEDWQVILNGVICWIDIQTMQCWHSSRLGTSTEPL